MDADDQQKKRLWSKKEAMLNVQKYCALQERSHFEVRTKLLEHGIYGHILEEILADLISNNFLNEERFAKSFARGKFRMKHWGRIKIQQALKQHGVSSFSIKEAMLEIDESVYLTILEGLLEKKDRTVTFKNQFDRMKKLTDYALSKGYEYELILEVIKNLSPKK